MARWVVLLRAVNVGGRKLAMADFRAALESVGHTDVATYIQSGNAVITTSERGGRDALAAEIGEAIEARTGMTVTAILRTATELRKALDKNPFRSVPETGRLAITFLSAVPAKAAVAQLEPERFPVERFEVIGSEIFLHYPNGMGTSKMTLDYFEKRLGVRGTSRNLNTIAKLIELAGD